MTRSTQLQRSSIVVLVIDDDEVGRQLLVDCLAPACGRVVQITSPIGATRIVVQESVDVVVLDVEMPNLRGDTLAKLFRSNPRIAHIGVVLVSGCEFEALATLGSQCGADAVVTKRDVRAVLLSAVQAAWRSARTRQPRGPEFSSQRPDTGEGHDAPDCTLLRSDTPPTGRRSGSQRGHRKLE